MRGDLNTLGLNPNGAGTTTYMVAAVEKHERVHVATWKNSVNPEFAGLNADTPRSVTSGDDFAGVGPGSGAQFWAFNGDTHIDEPKFSEGAGDSNFYFRPFLDLTAKTGPFFTRPAAGTFVQERVRNIIMRPGFQNWTGALFKNFQITENHRVQFRGEVYNIPNHPNWSDDPDRNPTSPTFGKITTKTFERTFQLSLRYSF